MCFVHVAVQSSFASIRLVHVEPHLSHAFVHSAFQACCCLKRTSRDGSEHPQLLNQQLFEKTTAITMFRTVKTRSETVQPKPMLARDWVLGQGQPSNQRVFVGVPF